MAGRWNFRSNNVMLRPAAGVCSPLHGLCPCVDFSSGLEDKIAVAVSIVFSTSCSVSYDHLNDKRRETSQGTAAKVVGPQVKDVRSVRGWEYVVCDASAPDTILREVGPCNAADLLLAHSRRC